MAENNSEKKPAHEVIIDMLNQRAWDKGNIPYLRNPNISTDEGFDELCKQRARWVQNETEINVLLSILEGMIIPTKGLLDVFGVVDELEKTPLVEKVLKSINKQAEIKPDPNLNEQ